MGAVAAAVLTLALTPVVLMALRRSGVLDHPNARSSHDTPVVRGGGIAIAVAALAAAWANVAFAGRTPWGLGGVVAAAVLCGAIGLAEDLRGIPSRPRLAVQLAASAVACVVLLDDLSGPLAWRVVFGAGAWLWIVAYTNGFNFMDGVNGISAVQSIVAGGVWWWIGSSQDVDALAWGGAILSGVAVGFLPYNFPRARLFLGDVGSYFIGGWQAALLVVGFRAGLPPEAVIAPLVVYLADTATTIVRRIVAGEVWHEPHRDHSYQRLVRQGWSHAATTALVGGAVAICSLLGILTLGSTAARLVADAGLTIVVLGYLTAPTWTARRPSSAVPR